MDKEIVLLFSGGLDSFIIKKVYYIKNTSCLFVRLNTNENKQEEMFIDTYFPGVKKIDFPLSQFELPNKIIPYRNHILALLAANYGNKIYFGFTNGDTTKDKDYVFKSQMEGILNYFSIDENKVTIPGPFEISMPFKEYTKTEMVGRYLAMGHPEIELLTHSHSCYEGTEKPCGICRSCLRKFVALKLNGYNCEEYFTENPYRYMHIFLEECISKNRKNEIKDIELCLKLKQQ